MKKRNRIAALVLGTSMMFSTLPVSVLAVEQPNQNRGGVSDQNTEQSFDDDSSFVTENTELTSNASQGVTDEANQTNVAEATINGKLQQFTTLQEALNANDVTSVKLLKDTRENVTIEKGKNVILDLNGYTLNGGTVSQKPALMNNGTVVIVDSSNTNAGTIKREDTPKTGAYYTIQNEGTMTIKAGTVNNNSGQTPPKWAGSSLIANSVKSGSNAVLNIEGGVISQDNFIAVKNDEYGAVLNITGGTISSKTQAVQNWATANISGGVLTGAITTWTYDNTSATTTVTGGTIKGEFQAVKYGKDVTNVNKPVVKIQQGNTGTVPLISGSFEVGVHNTQDFKPTEGAGEVSVSAGYFTSNPNEYVASNYYVVQSDKPEYTYMVTNENPGKAPVITTEEVSATVSKDFEGKEEDKNAVNSLLTSKAPVVNGVSDVLTDTGKNAILNAAGVTDDEKNNANKPIEIEIKAEVEVVQADLQNNELTFEVTPVAKVTVNGQDKQKEVPVNNSYLNGQEIAVKLPVPTDFTVKEIVHTSDTAATEHFHETGNKTFTLKDGYAELSISHFSTLKLSDKITANFGSGSGGATVKLNPVYRAYNPNNGEHLYTVDEKEYKHVASVGWDAEGVAFMAEEEKNGQALYRVYNPNSGLHHYTLDEKEKNTLVSFGWHDEKVAWYTSKKPQSAPVYRVYNPNDGNHHYTMNKQEKDVLVSYGWQDEGLAFRTAPIEK